MWTRELLKKRAKEILKNNYWQAFLVSLVIAIVTASGKYGKLERRINNHYYGFFNNSISGNIFYWSSTFFAFLASIAVILIILRVLVGYNLEVGGRRFFIKAAQKESDMNNLAYCFKESRYLGVIMAMLLRSVFTFLWFLLLIIPGIIKLYAYSMVPYILADNPFIGCERAIELSNQMTRKEKWDMFVLDLSFIGWYIVGGLAFGIGILFVNPYVNATKAELYLTFREEAIEAGVTSYEELNLEYHERKM